MNPLYLVTDSSVQYDMKYALEVVEEMCDEGTHSFSNLTEALTYLRKSNHLTDIDQDLADNDFEVQGKQL